MLKTDPSRLGRTPAQWYCLIAGGLLAAIGLLGFLASASFSTGEAIDGGNLLGFEVNGWHNLIHLASGLTLLAAANTRPTAKAVAIAFGVTYALVALIGLVDGSDVLTLMPVNAADNLLHLALAAFGVLVGWRSPATARSQRRSREGRFERTARAETEAPREPREPLNR